MAISVSVISHAFLTEKGATRARSRYLCQGVSSDNTSNQQVDLKIDNIACECMQSHDVPYLATTSQIQMAGCFSCTDFLTSPRSAMAASPSPRTIVGASPSPRLMAAANSSPHAGGGKSRKKGHKKRGGRRRGQEGGGESKEAKIMHIEETSIESGSREGAQPGAPLSCGNRGCGDDTILAGSCKLGALGDFCGSQGVHTNYMCSRGISTSNESVETQHWDLDVMLPKVREECSSALGIVKEDLELFGLCHIPSSVDRATLLKDNSGIVHLGVMVRNSDLNLQSIEELLIRKEKAEQEAESYRLQASEKSRDFVKLKLKYEKLTDEVLRLRTMVNRANHLRRESEKATEVLRSEFEKLVKTLFMECSHQSHDEAESANG